MVASGFRVDPGSVRWPSDPVPTGAGAPPAAVPALTAPEVRPATGPVPPRQVDPPVVAPTTGPVLRPVVYPPVDRSADTPPEPVLLETVLLPQVRPRPERARSAPRAVGRAAVPPPPVQPALAQWRAPIWPAQPAPPSSPTPPVPTPAPPVPTPTPAPPVSAPGGHHTGGYPVVQPTPVGPTAPRSPRPMGVLLLGLLIGLLVFGSTGYLVGATSGASTVDVKVDGAGAPAGTGQEEANRRAVGPGLIALAEAWVPWLSGCLSSSAADGPAAGAGERLRVVCAVNPAIDVVFIQYLSAADLDRARAARSDQNADSARVVLGAAPVTAQRAGTSGRTNGSYIEFAYRADGRTFGGIHWDDSRTSTAAYVEKPWSEGDGGWRPLRDMWQRYT